MISIHKRRKNKRSYIFLVLSTLVVLVGGTLTLLWQTEQRENSKADAGYIVGAPTLTAATINQIFARVGSPMIGTGEIVEQAARSANIDDAFALAVWWTETNDGAAGVGLADRNPGSVRGNSGYPAAFDGYTIYPSYAAAISDWFTLLRNRYVNRGLTSVYTICYPYVGTSGANIWANHVVNLMLRYHGGTSVTNMPITAPAPKPIVHISTNGVLTPVVKMSDKKRSTNSDMHIKEISKKQHQPITVGHEQAVIQASGYTAQNIARRSSATVHRHASEILTTHIQQFLIMLALLAAMLVMLPHIRIRRHMHKATEVEKITGRLVLFPVLYNNGYSPIAEMQKNMMQETGPLEHDDIVPVTPLLRGINAVPLTPFVAGRDDMKRRGNDTMLRRARLVPVELRGPEAATEAMGAVRLRTMEANTRER